MRRHNNFGDNLTALLARRGEGDLELFIRNRLQTAQPFLLRLELDKELEGHNGCVNCLEWSSDGRLLASGSDDYHLQLWDPFKPGQKSLADIFTPHRGNIFSVKFLPKTNNSHLVSGAGDSRIYVFDVNYETPIFKCQCHGMRVKRLAVAPETPYVFWSAAEDGNVFQFDIRQPHTCRSDDQIVMVALTNHTGRFAEAKCIAVNPRRPELIAVGSNDSYVRLYDRRQITLDKIRQDPDDLAPTNGRRFEFYDDHLPKGCVTYYCPGHLHRNASSMTPQPQRAATYVSFSPDGTELLVNMGSEQIYLYDIYNAATPTIFWLPDVATRTSGSEAKRPSLDIPEDVENKKRLGNELLEHENFLEAINQYSLAIKQSPNYAALYLNRAAALMKRKWRGDAYAALKDCQKALQLDPYYVKAHFRLARALYELEYVHEARECLNELKSRFPNYVNNHGVLMLNKDIESAINLRNGGQPTERLELSENETYWRSQAKDYKDRFVGHCNTKTDIKEANFFGNDARYVVAGSDDGNFFIWERPTNVIVEILHGDKSIVNCVQPHPYICMLATSGIDHEIRLWTPQPEEGYESKHRAMELTNVQENQERMLTDPFEFNNFAPVCRTS